MKRLREALGQRVRHRVPVVLYVSASCVVAVALWVWLLGQWGPPNLRDVLFFWALHMIAQAAPLEVHVSRSLAAADGSERPLTISGGGILLMTAVFATDPSTVATVALVPVFALRKGGSREGLVRKAFNTAQEVIYAGGAAAVYTMAVQAVDGWWAQVGAVVLAVALAPTLNGALVAGVVAVERRVNPLRIMHSLLWPFVHSVVFGCAAYLIAVLYMDAGVLAAMFIFTPLFVLTQARRAKLQLEEAQERTLRAFVRAIELKDAYTSRHSERVAEIAVQLHRKLGASEGSIRRRFYAALMHDLGKVAVPGRVLAKPGRLTEAEFDVVMEHPAIGAQVAGEIEALEDLIPEILHHHEQLDGEGYPDGLRGDDIPYEARVLAVADVFEALTSHRPYRRALSTDEAMGEIRRMVGSQLDVAPVRALEQLLEEGYVFAPLRPTTSPGPLEEQGQQLAENA